jgi:Domain of unknown function (DUF4129)
LPSQPEWCRSARRRALVAVLALPLAAPQAFAAAPATRAALTAAAVAGAASAVRADPDMGGPHKVRTWQFKRSDEAERPPSSPDPWLLEFARWLAEGGRLLVWLGGAAALAALLVGARRWLAVRGDAARRAGARLPSHVRELDIRPQSLPADIGAAVRAAWLAGQRRVALSLLYRGALSRLVHSLGVPIEDASTEGDCVRLARVVLPAERSAFVARLVLAWQLAVYGNRPVETAAVLALCDDFDRMLPASAAPGAT